MTLNRVDNFLAARSLAAHVVSALVLLVVMGAIDILIGPEFSFSFLYLVPIALVTWYTGFGWGALIAVASALLWLAADRFEGVDYAYTLAPYWNLALRLVFFLAIAYLLARLHQELRSEEQLARTDALTGLANSRRFHQEAEYEIHRSSRYGHAFTVAYIDLDNFKAMNDNFGHLTGDQVLQEVGRCLTAGLRRPDIVARLGGDEFVVLLPETDLEGARAILGRLQDALRASMRRHAWPVTFSIGAMTFVRAPESVDDILRRTDRLMYRVKASGKNDLNLAAYQGSAGSLDGPAARNRV